MYIGISGTMLFLILLAIIEICSTTKEQRKKSFKHFIIALLVIFILAILVTAGFILYFKTH